MTASNVSTDSSRPIAEPLTEREAATRLGLTRATLRAWRHRGMGPPFLRLGRAIRYLSSDLERFLAANRHTPAAGAPDEHLTDTTERTHGALQARKAILA